MNTKLALMLSIIVASAIYGGELPAIYVDPLVKTKSNEELLSLVLSGDRVKSWYAIPELVNRNDSSSINKIIVEGDDYNSDKANMLLPYLPRDSPGLVESLCLGMERIIKRYPMLKSNYDGGRICMIKTNSEVISDILKIDRKILDYWDDAEVYAFIATANRLLELPENQHLKSREKIHEEGSVIYKLSPKINPIRTIKQTPVNLLEKTYINIKSALSVTSVMTLGSLICTGLITFFLWRRKKRS